MFRRNFRITNVAALCGPAAATSAPTFALTDSQYQGSVGFHTTASFTASIGTAAASRIVVIGAGYEAPGAGTMSVTCNGTAMTPVVNRSQSNNPYGLFYLGVPSGTTAAIVIT